MSISYFNVCKYNFHIYICYIVVKMVLISEFMFFVLISKWLFLSKFNRKWHHNLFSERNELGIWDRKVSEVTLRGHEIHQCFISAWRGKTCNWIHCETTVDKKNTSAGYCPSEIVHKRYKIRNSIIIYGRWPFEHYKIRYNLGLSNS